VDLKTTTRRRGSELEAAILDAAWAVLEEGGYSGFTYEAVAERARTSKPVLYRRLPHLNALLLAAVRHHADTTRPSLPDTGSLRSDTIALLQAAEVRRADMLALNSAVAGIFVSDVGITPGEIREAVVVPGRGGMWEVVERALARGELTERPSDRVISVPTDLFRNEALLSFQPVPQQVIEQIVDEVFLPLVNPREVPARAGQP
jgi:AcrR family transcriptional regulator